MRPVTARQAIPVALLVAVAVAAVAVLALLAGLGFLAVGRAGRSAAPPADQEFLRAPGGRTLAWVTRTGAVTPLAAPPRGYVYPRLSPDARRVALDVRDAGRGIWIWDDTARTLSAAAVGRASDIAPLWAHGGDALVFARGRGVAPGLFWLDLVAGRAPARLPIESDTLFLPTSLFPGGRRLLVTATSASGFDILAVGLDDGRVSPYVHSPADELNGEVSPDGRWVAFQSRATGQFEVWLRPAADGAAAAWPVTTDGGTRPAWTKSGHELTYLTTSGTMTVRSVAADPPGTGHEMPAIGPPQPLFSIDVYQEPVGRTFDVTPDGARFLVILGQ